jgi:hypothetical protein
MTAQDMAGSADLVFFSYFRLSFFDMFPEHGWNYRP